MVDLLVKGVREDSTPIRMGTALVVIGGTTTTTSEANTRDGARTATTTTGTGGRRATHLVVRTRIHMTTLRATTAVVEVKHLASSNDSSADSAKQIVRLEYGHR